MDEIREERIRDAITLSKNMRNNGASLEAIESRLSGRGFDAAMIKAVMRHISPENPDNIILNQAQQPGGRMGLVIVGIMICTLGAFVVIGNRTGVAPTMPMFGCMIMVLGGALIALARTG